MANRRMINKDDFESMTILELTIRQRLLFCLLMLYADDDGIMPALLVKARCFPLDRDLDENDLLDDLIKLEELSFIILYENNQYLQITNWWFRQFIDKKIYKPTNHPKPPSYKPRPEDLKKNSRRVLEQNRLDKKSGEKTSTDKTSLAEIRKYKEPDLPFNDKK